MTSAEMVAADVLSDVMRMMIVCADEGDDICSMIPGSVTKSGTYLTFIIDTYGIYNEKLTPVLNSIDTTSCINRKDNGADDSDRGLTVYAYTRKDFPVSCTVMTRGDGGHIVAEVFSARISAGIPSRIAAAFRGSAAKVAKVEFI